MLYIDFFCKITVVYWFLTDVNKRTIFLEMAPGILHSLPNEKKTQFLKCLNMAVSLFKYINFVNVSII